MARARNIKPSFFTNEKLADLSFSTRLLFIGLWTMCDRLGRMEDRPKRIKMNLFPADRVDVNKGLAELATHGFITRYVVDGESFIEIPTFIKHQNPHIKEAASTIPAPDKHGASTVQAGLIPESPFLNPESLEREGETPLSLPPADFAFEDSAFEHPAVVVYQEKFQVKIRTNFAKAVADRVKNMTIWLELIADKIAWADEPLQKRQDIAKWFLKAYDERLAEKQNGGPPGRKGQPAAIVPIRPAMNEIDFQKRLMEQQPK